jgi:hypothetical protein
MSAPTVIGALRRFLPEYLSTRPVLGVPQRRALWAMQACRTPTLGGRVYGCAKCSKHHFAYHSCNHKACPQCGSEATRRWVAREQRKLISAPCFMVTFTLPSELRELFFGSAAKATYDAFFAAASRTLSDKLAAAKWLGAKENGFTAVLHTWNQQMMFHPHLHCIVPGCGLDAKGAYRQVKSAQFLLPVPVLSQAFRAEFKAQMKERGWQCDPAVWRKEWGVHVQACGSGENIVKYLGTYVARSVIADSRILSITDTHVTFRYKDRAHGGATRTLKLTGVEFCKRYLRHVLPRKLRSVRYYGWCHPAAKKTRLKVTALSGRRIELGAQPAPPTAPPHVMQCPCCQQPMELRGTFKPLFPLLGVMQTRGPPQPEQA